MPAPENVSYSQLAAYLRCGEQYRLTRVLKITENPSWAQVGGSAVHLATEWFDLGAHEELTGAELFARAFVETIADQEERTGTSHEEWRATGRASREWPNKSDGAWWAHHGPEFVNAWTAWRHSTQWSLWEDNGGLPGVEVAANGVIGGVPIKGYIDRVMVNQDGELVIVDLKTGTRTPEDKLQLGIYAELFERIHGIRPQWGGYWMARKGALTEPHPLDRYTGERLDLWFGRFVKAREHGIYIPHVDSHCNWCGVSEFCNAIGGNSAGRVDEEEV